MSFLVSSVDGMDQALRPKTGLSLLGRFIAVFLLCSSTPRLASAQSASAGEREACVRSYEGAQEHRLKSELRAALPELARCAESACPAFIRSDCARWSAEVQEEQPSLVFTVRSLGRHLDNVRISVDGVPIGERVAEEPFVIDPGMYVLTFEAERAEPLRQSVVVRRGERGKVIDVELQPLASMEAPPRLRDSRSDERPPLLPPQEAEPEASEPSAARVVDKRAVVLGAVGIAGLASFATLALMAHGDEAELRDTCSPACSDGEVSSVRTKYVLADVSLGVGVAALTWGAYLLWSTPEASRTARSKLKFDVALGSNNASASLAGAF